MSEYLSPCQVAKRLGKRVETVRNWIASGELKATNLGGERQVRMRVKVEWLESFERSRMAVAPTQQSRRKFGKPAVEYV